jgi:hypothetical protein
MIFNKSNNGDAELKSALGFTSASLSYEGIEPFMPLALRELLLVIPKAVYDLADDHYNNPPADPPEEDTEEDPEEEVDPPEEETDPIPSTEDLDELVLLCQRVLAFHAYLRFAPSNDLSHDGGGRRMYSSENEKSPFPWMIDNDNRNILKLAWDNTDILLQFLTEKAFAVWLNSDIYKASLARFIRSTAEFNAVFSIDNSFRMYFLLVPVMANTEMNLIRACFLPDVWESMITHMKTSGLTEQEKVYIGMIKECIPFYAMAEAISRFNIEVLPQGIFINSISGAASQKQPADIMDRGQAITFYTKKGDSNLRTLQNEIARVNNLANNINDTSSMMDPGDPDQKFLRF